MRHAAFAFIKSQFHGLFASANVARHHHRVLTPGKKLLLLLGSSSKEKRKKTSEDFFHANFLFTVSYKEGAFFEDRLTFVDDSSLFRELEIEFRRFLRESFYS